MIHQETQAQEGKLLQGRAALWYVYRQYALSAAATHAIGFQSLINLKFTGDLKGFLQSWDTCILVISLVPSPDLLHSLLEPKMRECKQLQPAFAHLDGNDPFSNSEQLKFIYRSACRVVENMKAERTKKERMRIALAAQNLALAAINQKAAEAKLAADAAAAAANPPPRRPRARSPRKAAAAALAAVPPPQPPLPPLGVCRAFSQDGSCKFGDRFAYKHLDSNGKETPKRKAAAKPKAQTKKGARTRSPRKESRRHSKNALEARKQIPCKFLGITGGRLKGETCSFAH